MKILNFGSLNIDYVYILDHLPRQGETISSSSRKVFAGGKGLNQSIAMARAGAKVYHAGAVGQEDGKFLIEILKKNEVDVSYVREIQKQFTGHAVISVDKKGQNSIILYGGTNQNITENHISETLSLFQKGDYLLLQNEINNLKYLIESAYAKGMIIVLNPSPMNEKLQEYDLGKVSYLILNEVEGKDITGKDTPKEILEFLLSKYPHMTVVLTLGVDGSIFKNSDLELQQQAYEVQAVDTTGAGDTFTGYLFALLSQGYEVKEAMKIASKASAISVTRNGAEASIPLFDEVINSF